MKIIIAEAIVALAAVSTVAHSQEGKSLEQLNREEVLSNAIDTINDVEASLMKITKRRDNDCAKAIGLKSFCECLSQALPVAWSFSDYVAITTKSKEENGYALMDKNLRAAYDKVSPVRDRCVRRINKP